MSKHFCLSIGLLILAVIALCGTAGATATTHIWGPSTDIQPFNLWHITSDFYLPIQKVETAPNTKVQLSPVTNLGLTVGVLPFEKVQMEIGADHKAGFGSADAYPMYFNAKLGTPEGAWFKHSPALAVGMLDLGMKKDVTDYNVVYGKAAYTLPVVGRISAGYFTGNKKLLLDSKGEKSNTGLMAAWERTMTEVSDKLWLCVEYMGSKSSYGTLNFGCSWKASDNVVFLAGYDVLNDQDLTYATNTLTFQADIDLQIFCCKKK
jgi:hypothetical protein